MNVTHDYLSTGCLHGEHDYCAAMVGCQGVKRPAQCKFCDATCQCWCHADAGAPETAPASTQAPEKTPDVPDDDTGGQR